MTTKDHGFEINTTLTQGSISAPGKPGELKTTDRLTTEVKVESEWGMGFLRACVWVVRVMLPVALVGGCTNDQPVVPGEETTGGGDGSSGMASTGALDTSGGATGGATEDTGIAASGSESDDTGIEPGCGNGIVEAGETCDEQGQTPACDEDCTPAACGDGLVNVAAGEECDDGGASETCMDCSLIECGDGVTNVTAGEACDDAGESATCNIDCSPAACGDGIANVTAGEGCDEAGETSSCNSDCSLSVCGDGIMNVTAGEACDDAGPSAACDDDCTSVACGDALANVPAGESCDGADLAGGTCEAQGFGAGALTCDEGCAYITSDCAPFVPVLGLSFSPIKQFDFSWAAAMNAEYYQLLESVAPGDPYAQLGGDLVGTSVSFEMPLHLRFGASYVLRACNAIGCTDSAAVDVVGSMAEAVGYFKASNTGAYDELGTAVALSEDGNTLVVSARREASNATGIGGDQANNSVLSAGAVYVFVRDKPGVWSQQAYIKASNTGVGDRFGDIVALSSDGNTLAVGAYREGSNATGIGGDQADNSAGYAGAVYVFVRDDAEVWSQQAYVKASNTAADDLFGHGVALSGNGNVLAVGAVREDGDATGIGGDQDSDAILDSGAVYLY